MQNMMEQKIMKRDSDTAWGIERRKELIINHWLMSVLVERGIEVIRRNLRGHVHICGVPVRIGIIVRLLVCGVCHDCRVCWCRRLKRLSHRLRGVFNGISLRDIALSRAGTKARGT